MERSDESSVGSSSKDFDHMTTRVDPAKERRILVASTGPSTGSLAPAKYALFFGLMTIAGFLVYRDYIAPASASKPVAVTSGAPIPDAAPATTLTEEQVAAIKRENDVQAVARAEPLPTVAAPVNNTIPPPPGDAVVEPDPAENPAGIIGQTVPLGLVGIEIENYWIDDGSQKGIAYAALTGYIVNASVQPLALPTLEVTLLDHEKRQYKPAKQSLSGNVTVNPRIKVKNTWFFELPLATPMYCAQFTTRENKKVSVAYVQLLERTPQNAALIESEDYEPELLKLMLDTSPRAAAAQEFYKAKFALDQIGQDAQVLEKQLSKLEKKMKVATSALDSATRNAVDAKAAVEASKNRMKEIEANKSTFKHNIRLQENELGKVRNELARRERDEVQAAEAIKEKTAAKGKADTEIKDLQGKIKQLATKYETQEKVVIKLKEKLE